MEKQNCVTCNVNFFKDYLRKFENPIWYDRNLHLWKYDASKHDNKRTRAVNIAKVGLDKLFCYKYVMHLR